VTSKASPNITLPRTPQSLGGHIWTSNRLMMAKSLCLCSLGDISCSNFGTTGDGSEDLGKSVNLETGVDDSGVGGFDDRCW